MTEIVKLLQTGNAVPHDELLKLLRTSTALRVLEPRMVFDGAAAPAAVEALAEPAVSPDAIEFSPTASETPDEAVIIDPAAVGIPGNSDAVVFIDGNVLNAGSLLSAVPDGADVVILDQTRDGLEQIAEFLAGRSGVNSIHIISHGEPGELRLGSTYLTTTTIGTIHAEELASIKASLSDDADILIYGCDVAAGELGLAFIEALAEATGADIAASEDATGTAVLGGDWDLEQKTGEIETDVINAPEWNGLLAPLTISTTSAPVTLSSTQFAWYNAGTVGGTVIDLRATVIATSGGFNSIAGQTIGDNPTLGITTNALGPGSVTVRWEIFAADPAHSMTIRAVGSPNFTISDIDGTGSPNTLETVIPSLNALTSYTVNSPTALVVTIGSGQVTASGTDSDLDNIPFGTSALGANRSSAAITLSWSEVSSWTVTYRVDAANQGRLFQHDGDGDFTFASPNTTYLLGIDLDANNSTASGTSYQNTLIENGTAVRVVDTDVAITQHSALGTQVHQGTVRLTNTQAGDQLLVNGSTATSGSFTAAGANFSYSITTNGAQTSVVVSGAATPAQYQAALQAITFRNTSENPAAMDRQFEIFVTNTAFGTSSNQAISTIHVTPINDAPAGANKTITMIEDGSYALTAADFGFSDVDGNAFSSVLIQPLSGGGTLTYNGTPVTAAVTVPAANIGQLVFTPAANANGSALASFNFQVIDNGGTANGGQNTDQTPNVITFNVTSVNDNPVAVTDIYTMPEDGAAISLAPLTADSDPDGGTLSVASINGTTLTPGTAQSISVPNGTVYVSAAGAITFAPNTNFNGTITFPYVVFDGQGGTATANQIITVTPVNDNPVAVTDSYSMAEDGPAIALAPLTGDSDVEGGALSIVSINGTALTPGIPKMIPVTGGTISISAAGVITFAPDANFNGTVTFPYVISDPFGGTSTANQVITITSVNDNPVASTDNYSMSEDGAAITLTPLTGDSDGDDGTLSVTSINGTTLTPGTAQSISVTGGTVLVSATGVITFVPVANFNGTVALPYVISDGQGGTATANQVITVTPVNDDPIAVTDTYSMAEDGPAIKLTPLAGDSDIDGDLLSIVSIAGITLTPGTAQTIAVVGGTVSISAAGAIAFVPNANFSGTVSFPYVIADGRGGTATANQVISVASINDVPVANPDTVTVAEGSSISNSLIANDTDGDGHSLIVTSAAIDIDGDGVPDPISLGAPTAILTGSGVPLGMMTVNADGTYTFTPAANYAGPVPQLAYTISDGNGGFASSTLSVTITSINDAPTGADNTINLFEDATYIFAAADFGFSDPDESPANGLQSVIITTLPSNGTLSLNGVPVNAGDAIPAGSIGQLTFTPGLNANGAAYASFTFQVVDDGGTANGGEDTDASPNTIVFSVAPVNDAPAGTDSSATIDEDTTYTFSANDFGFSDPSDTPANALQSVIVTTLPLNGVLTLSGFSISAGAIVPAADLGQLVFTPAPGANGANYASFSFQVVDDGGTSNGGQDTDTTPNTFALHVDPVDDPGSITGTSDNAASVPGTDAEVLESDLPTGSTPSGTRENIAGSFGISDADGIASLTIGSTTVTLAQLQAATPASPVVIADPIYGTLNITGFDATNGTVTYIFVLDATATNIGGAPVIDALALVLTDVNGMTTPGTLAFAILDDAPIAVDDVDRTISLPGNPSSVAAGNVVTGALSSTDPNTNDGTADVAGADGLAANPVTGVVAGTGTPLASSVGASITTALGTLVLNADGSYLYTPDYANPVIASLGPDQSLADTFTFQITDADGSTSTATLTISITGTPAIISAGTASPGGIDGTVLESDLSSGTNPAGTGEQFSGAFSAVVTAPDVVASVTIGGISFDPATLGTASQSTPLTVTTAFGSLDVTGFDPVTGTISYIYTLQTSQDHSAGPVFDEIAVSVTSNFGDTGNGTLRFAIADDQPIAMHDIDSVLENGISAATGNVFTGFDSGLDANTTDGIADISGADSILNPVTAVGAGTALPAGAPGTPITGQYGTLVLAADGTYVYVPDRGAPAVDGLQAGESLNDVFTYEIADGDGDRAIATLTITILGANDAPVAANDTVTMQEDGAAIPLDPLVNDTDIDGDPISIASINGTPITPGIAQSIPVAGGIVDITPFGDISFMPAANFAGTIAIPYMISDGNGGIAAAKQTITVVPVNDPPVATDDASTVSEDGPAVSGSLITGPGTDTDVEGDVLTITSANHGASALTLGTPFQLSGGGMLVIAADGTYTFDPGNAYNGLSDGETYVETISYMVSDGDGGTDTAILVLTVNGANDAPVVIDPLNPGTPENPTQAPDPLNIIPDVTVSDGRTPTPIDVSNYVRDPEGDSLQYAATGLPAGLTIDPATGVISGTLTSSASQGGPDNDGVYRVTLTITDGNGGLTITTVTYTVINPLPVPQPDTAAATEDTTLTVPNSSGLLANDDDPDGDTLEIAQFEIAGVSGSFTPGSPAMIPGVGTLTIEADGGYTFDPAADYNGSVPQVTYTVIDADGATATATLALSITPVNDAPVGGPLPDAAGSDGSALTPISTAGAFSDVDGDTLTYSLSSTAPSWLVIDPVTGEITGTPPANASQLSNTGSPGEYLIIVMATDPSGATGATTVALTIANPPPVAVDDGEFTAIPGIGNTYNVLGNDFDGGSDNDPLTVVLATAANGAVTINPDGTITYKANPGFVGADIITYTIGDGNGGTSTAQVNVDVLPEPHVDSSLGSPFPQDLMRPAIEPFSIVSSLTAPPIVVDSVNAVDHLGLNHWANIFSATGHNGSIWTALGARVFGEPQGMVGFSLEDNIDPLAAIAGTDQGQVSINTYIRGRLLMVHLDSQNLIDGVTVQDWRVKQVNGEERPAWLELTGQGFLIGERPASLERLELAVTVVLSDGREITKKVLIELKTGEIKLIQNKRADALPFERQFKARAMLNENGIHYLGQSLKSAAIR